MTWQTHAVKALRAIASEKWHGRGCAGDACRPSDLCAACHARKALEQLAAEERGGAPPVPIEPAEVVPLRGGVDPKTLVGKRIRMFIDGRGCRARTVEGVVKVTERGVNGERYGFPIYYVTDPRYPADYQPGGLSKWIVTRARDLDVIG